MPGFTEKDGCYFISYITGPAHVYLGIKFVPHQIKTQMIKQSARGNCYHGDLDETQIIEAVEKALVSLCHKYQVKIYAAEIIYVENDTPRYDLFTIAAHRLIDHYINGGEFQLGK